MRRDEIQQSRPFASRAEEAFLDLQRTASVLLRDFTNELKAVAGDAPLTQSQYNVLRILRGVHPDAIPCGEIGDRLVTPGPDVTRLLDRLAEQGLIARERDTADRRIVKARITPAGLDLLARLDVPVQDFLARRLGHLSEEEQQALVHLLERARSAR